MPFEIKLPTPGLELQVSQMDVSELFWLTAPQIRKDAFSFHHGRTAGRLKYDTFSVLCVLSSFPSPTIPRSGCKPKEVSSKVACLGTSWIFIKRKAPGVCGRQVIQYISEMCQVLLLQLRKFIGQAKELLLDCGWFSPIGQNSVLGFYNWNW